MAFILDQQDQFAVNTQRLQKDRRCDNPRQRQCEMIVQLAETTDTLLDRLRSNMDTLESNMAALTAAQAHTAGKLSALINIVREDRNEKP